MTEGCPQCSGEEEMRDETPPLTDGKVIRLQDLSGVAHRRVNTNFDAILVDQNGNSENVSPGSPLFEKVVELYEAWMIRAGMFVANAAVVSSGINVVCDFYERGIASVHVRVNGDPAPTVIEMVSDFVPLAKDMVQQAREGFRAIGDPTEVPFIGSIDEYEEKFRHWRSPRPTEKIDESLM